MKLFRKKRQITCETKPWHRLIAAVVLASFSCMLTTQAAVAIQDINPNHISQNHVQSLNEQTVKPFSQAAAFSSEMPRSRVAPKDRIIPAQKPVAIPQQQVLQKPVIQNVAPQQNIGWGEKLYNGYMYNYKIKQIKAHNKVYGNPITRFFMQIYNFIKSPIEFVLGKIGNIIKGQYATFVQKQLPNGMATMMTDPSEKTMAKIGVLNLGIPLVATLVYSNFVNNKITKILYACALPKDGNLSKSLLQNEEIFNEFKEKAMEWQIKLTFLENSMTNKKAYIIEQSKRTDLYQYNKNQLKVRVATYKTTCKNYAILKAQTTKDTLNLFKKQFFKQLFYMFTPFLKDSAKSDTFEKSLATVKTTLYGANLIRTLISVVDKTAENIAYTYEIVQQKYKTSNLHKAWNVFKILYNTVESTCDIGYVVAGFAVAKENFTGSYFNVTNIGKNRDEMLEDNWNPDKQGDKAKKLANKFAIVRLILFGLKHGVKLLGWVGDQLTKVKFDEKLGKNVNWLHTKLNTGKVGSSCDFYRKKKKTYEGLALVPNIINSITSPMNRPQTLQNKVTSMNGITNKAKMVYKLGKSLLTNSNEDIDLDELGINEENIANMLGMDPNMLAQLGENDDAQSAGEQGENLTPQQAQQLEQLLKSNPEQFKALEQAYA